MAHYIAEVMEEAENTEGKDQEMARKRAVDLILRIWSRKKDLPNGAYPLNDLKTILSVVGRLSPKASPYQWHGKDETENLLSKIFDGLQLVAVHGIILVAETKGIPDDLDATMPFLDEEEQNLIETIKGWIDYVNTGLAQPSLVTVTKVDKADLDAKQAELAKLEELDPKSRSDRILSREIDGLIEALSHLKLKLVAEDPESNGED